MLLARATASKHNFGAVGSVGQRRAELAASNNGMPQQQVGGHEMKTVAALAAAFVVVRWFSAAQRQLT